MNANDMMPRKPERILVVDDDISVLTVMKCMLECYDYSVLLADSAETAMRLAANQHLVIDLLITDIVMPAVQGPELADRMLALRPEMKVLYMSGYADSEVVRFKVLDPSVSFLPKPFTTDGLIETVERALRGPRLRHGDLGSHLITVPA